MKLGQIHKIYLSHFLCGLIFWYGIEKLFMTSIGIDALGVGIVTAVYVVTVLVLDIPSGILADKWNRKGVLAVAVACLGLSSLVMGLADNLAWYIVGDILYGLFMVGVSGTYNALIYDSLREEDRTQDYSKVAGYAFGMLAVGAGIGNFLSGFLAQHFSYRMTFFISIASSLINILVIFSLHEPLYHKRERKERVLRQLRMVVSSINRMAALRTLVIVMGAIAIVELFGNEFSQLYIMHFVQVPEAVGVIWGFGAIGLAAGGFLAHRFKRRLHVLLLTMVSAYMVMAVVNSPVSLAFFVLQTAAITALVTQIESRLQDATPSSVRASVLSVASAFGRFLCVPGSFLLGWIIREHGALWGVRSVAVVAVVAYGFWLVAGRSERELPPADLSDSVPPFEATAKS